MIIFQSSDAHRPRQVANFLIDTDDDECPDFSLHLAAFLGDGQQVEEIMSNPDNKHLLRDENVIMLFLNEVLSFGQFLR